MANITISGDGENSGPALASPEPQLGSENLMDAPPPEMMQQPETVAVAEPEATPVSELAAPTPAQGMNMQQFNDNRRAIGVGNFAAVRAPQYNPVLPRPGVLSAETDVLGLEFPSLKEQIDQTRADGWSDLEIRQYLTQQEALSIFVDGYSADAVDEYLGRTPESKRSLYKAAKSGQEDAYYKVLGDNMTREQIREMLHVSEIVGVAPSMLYQYPDIYKHAQEIAGRRAGMFELIGDTAVKTWSGYYQGRLAKRGTELSDKVDSAEKRQVNGEIEYLPDGTVITRPKEITPARAEKLMAQARKDYMELQNDIAWHDKYMGERERLRIPDSVVGAYLISIAESAGFSIASGSISGLGRVIGGALGGAVAGPWGAAGGQWVGGAMASFYNTDTEAKMEAGAILLEKMRENIANGLSFEDAIETTFLETRQIVQEVYRNNIILLGPMNLIGDALLHGLGGSAARTAGKITAQGVGGAMARGALTRFLPYVASAIPEAIEEGAQEIIQSRARGEEIDWRNVAEAAKIGAGSALIYGAVGRGIVGAHARWQQRGKIDVETDAKIDLAAQTAERLANGEIGESDIVGQDDFIFINKNALDQMIGTDGKKFGGIREEYDLDAQAEGMEIGEYALTKSEYDYLAKQYPELAEALKDDTREGVKGVTAREAVRSAVHWMNEAQDSPLNADTLDAGKARTYATSFKEGLVSAGMSPTVADGAGAIYGHSLLAQSKAYGMTVDQVHRARIKSAEQKVQDGSERYDQRAWHGSPHNFDQFSTDAIGTGEGAQAFGWGMYFAGSVGTAAWYRDTLSSPHNESFEGSEYSRANNIKISDKVYKNIDQYTYKDGDFLDESGNAIDPAIADIVYAAREYGNDIERIRGFLEKNKASGLDFLNQLKSNPSPRLIPSIEAQEASIRNIDAALELIQENAIEITENDMGKLHRNKGYLYEVDIPESDTLLDWDKPLSEQPEAVRKGLSEAFDGKNLDGQMTGKDIYNLVDKDPKTASMNLRSVGILGIQYLDGQSRREGDGTHNYVIFDDSKINILKILEESQGIAIQVTGNEFEKLDTSDKDNITRVRKAADEWYRENLQGTSVNHPSLGDVEFTGKGRKETLYFGKEPRKYLLIPHLRELIKTAKITKPYVEVRDRDNKKNIKYYHYLWNDFVLDGERYGVKIDIFEDNNGKKYYDLGKFEALEGNEKAPSGFSGLASSGEGSAGRPADGANADILSENTETLNTRSTDETNLLIKEVGDPKGSITFDRESGLAFIELFKNADISTIFHEFWHLGLDNLIQFGALPDASERARQDKARALEWLGIADLDLSRGTSRAALGDENYARYEAAQEKWARGGEKFQATGKAPNPGLQGVFDRIKMWMLETIQGVAKDMDIPDDVAEIYGRMLATPIDTNPLWDANTTVAQLVDLSKQTDKAVTGDGEVFHQGSAREQIRQEERARYREILENKEKLDRKKKDVRLMLKDILAATKSKEIYAAVRNEIKAMLTDYKLDPNRRVTRDMLTEDQVSARAAKRAERNAETADRIIDLIAEDPAFADEIYGIEGVDRAEILDLLERTTLDQMTLAELTALYTDVMTKREEGTEILRGIQAANETRRRAQSDAAVASLKKNMKPLPKGVYAKGDDVGKQYKGITGKAEKIKDWTYAWTLGGVRLFDWFDGGRSKDGKEGIFSKIFFTDANACRDAELRNERARRTNVEQHMEDLGISARDLAKEVEVDGVSHIGGEKITKDALLDIYAKMKNRKGRAALIYGSFYDYMNMAGKTKTEQEAPALAAINKCIAALSDGEKRFADLIMADGTANFGRINDVLMQVYNISMEQEEFYSNLVRLERSGKGVRDAAPSSGAFGLGGSILDGKHGRLDKGFSVSRIQIGEHRQGAIKLGLYSNWCDNVSTQEHTIAFAELISDTNALLNYRPGVDEIASGETGKTDTIHNLLRRKFGNDAWTALEEYNNILTRNDTAIAHAVMNNTSRMLARNMTVAYLCGNLATILKQTTSLPRFLVAAGPHRILASLGEFMAGSVAGIGTGENAFLERIYDLDPQMRARAGDVMLEAVRSDPAWGSTWYQQALDIGLAPISAVDRWIAAIGWKAVFDKGIAEGKSVEAAAREAQRVVILTQQTVHAKDAPMVWRQSGIARLAMIFTSEAAQMWGMGVYDFAQQIGRGDIKGMLASVTAMTVCATIMRMITDGAPEDGTPEAWAKWVGAAMAEQSLSSIPLIGKDMVAMWQELDGSGYFGAQPTALGAPFAKAIKGAYWLLDDKDTNDERAAWSIIEGLSLLGARFPVTAARRFIDAGYLMSEGEQTEALLRVLGRRSEAKKVMTGSMMF